MSHYTSQQNFGGAVLFIGAGLTVAGVAFFSGAAAIILLGAYMMALGVAAFTG